MYFVTLTMTFTIQLKNVRRMNLKLLISSVPFGTIELRLEFLYYRICSPVIFVPGEKLLPGTIILSLMVLMSLSLLMLSNISQLANFVNSQDIWLKFCIEAQSNILN